MNSKTEQRASCLCGSVRVIAHPKTHNVGVCHCEMCRKWGGGPLFAVECKLRKQAPGSQLYYFRDRLKIPKIYQVSLNGTKRSIDDQITMLSFEDFCQAENLI